MRKMRSTEIKGRGYHHPIPFSFNENKKINIIKCHYNEGIDENIIKTILKRAKVKYLNVHRRERHLLNSYFITEVLTNLPPIRVTVVFREKPDEIIITNAFLGSVLCKNAFEKNYKVNSKNFNI